MVMMMVVMTLALSPALPLTSVKHTLKLPTDVDLELLCPIDIARVGRSSINILTFCIHM